MYRPKSPKNDLPRSHIPRERKPEENSLLLRARRPVFLLNRRFDSIPQSLFGLLNREKLPRSLCDGLEIVKESPAEIAS